MMYLDDFMDSKYLALLFECENNQLIDVFTRKYFITVLQQSSQEFTSDLRTVKTLDLQVSGRCNNSCIIILPVKDIYESTFYSEPLISHSILRFVSMILGRCMLNVLFRKLFFFYRCWLYVQTKHSWFQWRI